jgi:hypothetical protein
LRDVAVPRLRIAILSDFHANRPFMGPGALNAAGRTNARLAADMILLLGDYAGHVIGGRSLSPEEVTDALRRSVRRLVSLPSSETTTGATTQRPHPVSALPTIWHRAFDAAGFPCSAMTSCAWRCKGTPIQLAGLESQRAFKLRNPRRVRGEDDFPRSWRNSTHPSSRF